MRRIFSRFALPLLAKELIEQSARKRTYVIRVLYAVMLFFIAFLCFYEKLQQSVASPLAVLGSGRELFTVLVVTGFGGIYLFMPAITCSVISQEKERASLQLLFLTRLGPWAILFEKLLGRLVPMLGFLLLSLPLMGFAYTLGGVSQQLLWTGVWLLVLAMIQFGTLALTCSSFCRTTVGSFVASYLIGLVMLFGPYLVVVILMLAASLVGLDGERLFSGGPGSPAFTVLLFTVFPFFSLMWFVALVDSPGGIGLGILAGHSLIVFAVSGVFLGVARRSLVRRAFLPAQSRWVDFLKNVDRRLFRRRGGIDDSASRLPVAVGQLPVDEPVAWRETTKRSLARPAFLLIMALVLEIPLLFILGLLLIVSLAESQRAWMAYEMGFVIWVLTWGISVLVVSVAAASLIAGERTRQSLDVLCATPLVGRDILLQKMRSVRRLVIVFGIPLLTLFVFRAYWVSIAELQLGPWFEGFDSLVYLVCSFLSVVIYLPLVAWTSFLAGLLVRTQVRAIIASLAAIVIGCVAPLVFLVIPFSIAWSGQPGAQMDIAWLSLTSPASITWLNQDGALAKEFGHAWLALCINFASYGALLLVIRHVCLRFADRWLGRLEPKPGSEPHVAKRDSAEAVRARDAVREREEIKV